jgi:hypothetical protein
MYFSFSGPVKLAKEKALPGPKGQRAFVKKNHFRTSDHGGKQMGGGVPFLVFVGDIRGDHFFKGGKQIFLDGRVRSFVYGQSRGGVRIVEKADARAVSGFADCPVDLSGYVD